MEYTEALIPRGGRRSEDATTRRAEEPTPEVALGHRWVRSVQRLLGLGIVAAGLLVLGARLVGLS